MRSLYHKITKKAEVCSQMLRIASSKSLSSCELDVDRWTFVYLLNARGSSIHSVGNRDSGALHSLLSRNIVSHSYSGSYLFSFWHCLVRSPGESGTTHHQQIHN